MSNEFCHQSPAPIQTRSEISDDTFLEELAGEVASALDAILVEEPAAALAAPGPAAEPEPSELPQNLFFEIAASYSAPIRNFIFELKRHSAGREWIEFSRPALRAILKAAQQMDLPRSSLEALESFDDALAMAEHQCPQAINGEVRQTLLWRFQHLSEALPQIFALDSTYSQREHIIIEALLRQVKGVGPASLKRIYAAGLNSLEAFFSANAADLSAVTGLPKAQCQSISAKFQAHLDWVTSLQPDIAEKICREKLNELTLELKAKGKQRASKKKGSPAAAKTRSLAKQQKEKLLLQIRVLLAEMGKIELIETIKKAPLPCLVAALEGLLAEKP